MLGLFYSYFFILSNFLWQHLTLFRGGHFVTRMARRTRALKSAVFDKRREVAGGGCVRDMQKFFYIIISY